MGRLPAGELRVTRSQDNAPGPITEMAIVDTFTKLIFGDERYSDRESMIIEALRSVNADVLRDTHREIGEYLRSLGVREMIQLVSRVKEHIEEHGDAPAAIPGQPEPGVGLRTPGRTRRSH